jgi:hypothetical protein
MFLYRSFLAVSLRYSALVELVLQSVDFVLLLFQFLLLGRGLGIQLGGRLLAVLGADDGGLEC